MPKGPHGEKRPKSPTSSMVRALEVATGIKKEEYDVEETPKGDNEYDDESSDDDDGEYEIAALESSAVPPLKPKKRRKKSRKKS